MEKDICKNRHRGNAESEDAFDRIHDKLPAQRAEVLNQIRKAGSRGLCCHELAKRWGLAPNDISGRFSELSRDNHIRKIGRRPTGRGNSKAGVYVCAI